MSNVCVAFEILGLNERAPPGWHKASGRNIFDVKMDFTPKAHWVKDGHKTHDSTTPSFAGVVSRESIQITLMLLHCLAFQFREVVSGMHTYKPLALKNALFFVVRNLCLSM
jgi:hypothetical protein